MSKIDNKHTPGPWHVYLDSSIHAEGHQLGNPTSCIVHCIEGDQQHWPEVKANALLIAAAPDLLAACLSAKEALSGAVTQHSTGCGIYQRRSCDCWLPLRRSALAEIEAVLQKVSPPDSEDEETEFPEEE